MSGRTKRPGLGRRAVLRTGRVLSFAGWYAVRLVQTNLTVAREILTPGSGLHPAVVRVPVRAVTDSEIAAVTLAVSLTPGTLVLAVHRDPMALSVHGMYAADPVAVRRYTVELERRVLAALRPADHPAADPPAADPPAPGPPAVGPPAADPPAPGPPAPDPPAAGPPAPDPPASGPAAEERDPEPPDDDPDVPRRWP